MFSYSPCFRDEADGIDLLLALTLAGFLAGLSGIRVGRGIVQKSQTWGWKALWLQLITFGFVRCITDTFVPFV